MSDNVQLTYEVKSSGRIEVRVEVDPYEQKYAKSIVMDLNDAKVLQDGLNKTIPMLEEISKILVGSKISE